MQKNQKLALMWLKLVAVLGIAFYAWGASYGWQLSMLGVYQYFPLLGLSAWLIMWTHYIWGALGWRSALYSRVTGYIVLALIFLHPGLLAYAQNKNGQGLPPLSLYHYEPQHLQGFVFLGTISFFTFLSFEVFNRLKKKHWVQRNWRWVSLSQAIAMTLIFIHSLRLGDQLISGWFTIFWIFCGLVLLPCMIILVRRDFKKPLAA